MPELEKHFKLLGLRPSSNWDAVRANYRKLMKTWHPDRFTQDPFLQAKAEAHSKDLNNAFRTLYNHFHSLNLTGLRSGSYAQQFWQLPTNETQTEGQKPGIWKAVEIKAKSDKSPTSKINCESLITPSIQAKEENIKTDSWVFFNTRRKDPDKKVRYKNSKKKPARTSGKYHYLSLLMLTVLFTSIALPRTSPLNKIISGLSGEGIYQYQSTNRALSELLRSSARCDLSKMEKALNSGTDLNIVTTGGDTALSLTIKNGCLSGSKLLLKHEANPYTAGTNGYNSIDWAQWVRNYPALELMKTDSMRAQMKRNS